MDFNRITPRKGSHQAKWARADAAIGLTGDDALPMWVADMDFDTAPHILQALRDLADTGILGYFTGTDDCSAAIAWWMQTRHGWTVDPAHVLYTHGLGNAIGVCLRSFSDPGDEVITFTPVYHEFANKIRKNGRENRQCPLIVGADGRFEIDWGALESGTTGREKIMLISSPHNPGGRIWSPEDQRALADYCARHDLILLCDEIHHDLILPGQSHVPMPVAAPEVLDRLVMLTAASKTFNIAGLRLGSLIVPDEALRTRLAAALAGLDIQPNIAGVRATQAAYSPEGAAWVDALTGYLAENAQVFGDGIAAIPGLSMMPMEATYLAWVDFAALGMSPEEINRRIVTEARLGPSPGAPFGKGGESGLRFNIGTQRSRVLDAVSRLQAAFADVQ